MSSFGEELRRERELREISLREVAEATKVSIRHLEAMERNDFDHLPGGVFNRGFVRAYAQFIGIDPEATVNAYLLEEQAQRQHGRAADPAVMRGRERTRPGSAKPRSPAERTPARHGLRWGLIVLCLAIILLVVGFFVFDAFVAEDRTPTPPSSREGRP